MHNDLPYALIISTVLRFSLTSALCSVPFLIFGVNPVGAGYAMLIFAVCAFMLSKPILEWIIVIGTTLRQQPYIKWQGIYYEFAGTQIKIYYINKTIWFVGSDVLKVIGQQSSLMLESTFDVCEYDFIPDTRIEGFSLKGVEKLLRSSNHFEARRM